MSKHRSARKSESRPQRRGGKHASRRAWEKTNVLPLRSRSSSPEREQESGQQESSMMTWPLQILDIMTRPWRSFMPFVPFADTWMQEVANFPRTETRETDEAYLYSVELPGILPDQITLHLQNGMLMLEVEDQKSQRDKSSQRSFRRSFRRTFSLPAYTNSEGIKASLNDGVLTIAVPKAGQPGERISRDIGIR